MSAKLLHFRAVRVYFAGETTAPCHKLIRSYRYVHVVGAPLTTHLQYAKLLPILDVSVGAQKGETTRVAFGSFGLGRKQNFP
jgi:hypothetical protein